VVAGFADLFYFALAGLKYRLNNPIPICRFIKHTMTKPSKSIHFLSRRLLCGSALGLCCLLAMTAHAAPNDVDEEGRLIAAPDETDLVERGYLFYPQRVLPKKSKDKRATQANAGGKETSAPTDSDTLVSDKSAIKDPDPEQPKAESDTHAADTPTHSTSHKTSVKPIAASVIVQPLEPVKRVLVSPADSKGDASHSQAVQTEVIKPPLSKAEQARADRAKAALAKAEKAKEEQAKAEAARLERAKEAQARAELVKEERARVAQARAEKLKEEQAKAELSRAERAKAVAQARLLKAQDDLAKAEKRLDDLVMVQLPKVDAANNETNKDQSSKEEPTNSQPAKVEPVKTEPVKEEQAKAEPGNVEPAKDERPTAEPMKTEVAKTEPATTEAAAVDAVKDEHAKATDAAHEPHGSNMPAQAAPTVQTAGQKLLLVKPDTSLLTATD